MLAPGCEWVQIQHARVAEGALWFSFVPGYNVTGALQRAVIHPWWPELCDLLGFHHRLQDLTMGISVTKPNLETGIQASVEPSSFIPRASFGGPFASPVSDCHAFFHGFFDLGQRFPLVVLLRDHFDRNRAIQPQYGIVADQSTFNAGVENASIMSLRQHLEPSKIPAK
jgi:hypothetical protein